MPDRFFIAKHRPGDAHYALTPRGTPIKRESSLLIPDLKDYDPMGMGLFDCMPYDDHFIYKNPDFVSGQMLEDVPPWLILCTCGWPASVVWGEGIPADYQLKIACHYDCENGFVGKHATEMINIKDFELHKYVGKRLKRGDD